MNKCLRENQRLWQEEVDQIKQKLELTEEAKKQVFCGASHRYDLIFLLRLREETETISCLHEGTVACQ